MSESKKIYFYIAANLAFLIPAPGRFAYALIMIVLFNIQMATITMVFHAIYHMQLENLRNAVLTLFIIALGVFYKQLLAIVCPIAALTLGYCIFLPTLASVIIKFFFLNYEKGFKKHLVLNMKNTLFMSIFALLFFLVRDVFGYGTLTLPAWKKIVVFHLPYDLSSASASVFLATIPGALVLVSVIMALYIFVMNKIRILMNSPKALVEEA